MTAAVLVSRDPGTLVDAWRAGVLGLDPQRIPCPGILWREYGAGGRNGVWTDVHAAMLAFLDAWGERAADLGWTDVQLFGVHRTAGALRSDSTGALVTLYPYAVEAMDARTITLTRASSRLVFRGLRNPSDSVPLWSFRPDGYGARKNTP